MLLLEKAAEGSVELFSPQFVKVESQRVLKGARLVESEKEVDELPVVWVPLELYEPYLIEAAGLIAHKPDRHVVACALYLNAGILSANTRHFNTKRLRKRLTLWGLGELLKKIEWVQP